MDIGPLIEQLKREESALQKKIEELAKPLSQAQEDLRSVQGTIAYYERAIRTAPTSQNFVRTGKPIVTVAVFSAASLRGLSHKKAVVAIARHNGGIIKAQEAKRMMIQAGIMRDTKNSTHMVHNAIITSDRFERIGRGEFRLKPISVLPKATELEDVARIGMLPLTKPQ